MPKKKKKINIDLNITHKPPPATGEVPQSEIFKPKNVIVGTNVANANNKQPPNKINDKPPYSSSKPQGPPPVPVPVPSAKPKIPPPVPPVPKK